MGQSCSPTPVLESILIILFSEHERVNDAHSRPSSVAAFSVLSASLNFSKRVDGKRDALQLSTMLLQRLVFVTCHINLRTHSLLVGGH